MRFSHPLRRNSSKLIFILSLVIFVFLVRCLRHRQRHLMSSVPSVFSQLLSPAATKRLMTPCGTADSSVEAQSDVVKRTRFDLTKEIILHKRCIRVKRDASIDRNDVQFVDDSLLLSYQGQFIDLDVEGAHQWDSQKSSHAPLTLTAPPPFPPPQASSILFGLATTFDRLYQSINSLTHWLAYSGSTLVAVIMDASAYSEDDFEKLIFNFRQQGIDLVAKRPWDSWHGPNEQHFTIVRDLVQQATSGTRWVAVIDDDTFFPSLGALSKMLTDYNPARPFYIGGLSESFDAVSRHGYMAYGGAGVFLSLPLARELDPLIEECLESDNTPQGDAVLDHCIRRRTKTRLSVVSDLQQIDMRGDMTGFYESGRLPLSLHHWKSWHHVPIEKMAKITDLCGGCFLQRWRFGTDTILSNGYSLAVYQNGTAGLELSKMEGTWDNLDDFEWSIGPTRDKIGTKDKKLYLLIDTEQVGDRYRQVYIHRASGGSSRDRWHYWRWDDSNDIMDEVVELWWEVEGKK